MVYVHVGEKPGLRKDLARGGWIVQGFEPTISIGPDGGIVTLDDKGVLSQYKQRESLRELASKYFRGETWKPYIDELKEKVSKYESKSYGVRPTVDYQVVPVMDQEGKELPNVKAVIMKLRLVDETRENERILPLSLW